MLSVFDQPASTLAFCNSLHARLGRRGARVTLDLNDVQRVSSDALFLMRAMMDDRKGVYFNIGGNLPTDTQAAAKINGSGFFEGMAVPPSGLPQPTGILRRKSKTVVDSAVAADLVEFAQKHANFPKSVADASYENFVELMLNTHNHATRHGRKERWFAGVYCEDGIAYFTFIDLGVGILRSAAPRRFLKSRGLTLLVYGEPALMKDVFRGKIGASADIAGRGFGLTNMRAMAESGALPELQVLTSSVMGDVAGLSFRRIDSVMHGTVFRWNTKQPVGAP